MSIHGHGHFLTLAQGHLYMKIKTCFSQKQLGHFQPNFVCNNLGIRKVPECLKTVVRKRCFIWNFNSICMCRHSAF